MGRKNEIISFLCFFCTIPVSLSTTSAQNLSAYGSIGAISAGMGGSGTLPANEWSLFNNVGALSANENILPSVLLAFENRFGINSFNSYHFGLVSPLSLGGVGGISLNRFGDKYFNQTQVGIGYSHRVSTVSVGLKVRYHQLAVNDQIGITQGSRSTFLLELGGVAQLSPKWSIGVYGYNFTQSKLKVLDENEDRIPVILKTAISYQPTNYLFFSVETEKHIDYPATFRVGLNYQIQKYFYIRTGFSTQPFFSAFGVGFHPKEFAMDYALSNQTVLGWVHQISICYALSKLKLQQKKISQE